MSPATTRMDETPAVLEHTQDPQNPNHLRNKPCGHALHPGITKYRRRQCPMCRMQWAMDDVREQHDRIMSKGGMEAWKKKAGRGEERDDWITTCNGPRPRKNEGHPKLNEYGENTCFRSAKARLHNLAIELEECAKSEECWERRYLDLPGRQTRMKYSAMKAMELFNEAVEKGTITKVQHTSLGVGRKRGREWEAVAHPDYPAGKEVETKHPRRGTNAAQRKFIEAFTKEDESGTESASEPAPERKRRKTGAKVLFNEVTYVREEAEIDNLCTTYAHEKALPPGRSIFKPRRRTLLQKILVKNDPRPRRPYLARRLRQHCGGKRKDEYRRKHAAYKTNDWTVPSDRKQANTSGDKVKWQCWEKSAQRIDAGMHMTHRGRQVNDNMQDADELKLYQRKAGHAKRQFTKVKKALVVMNAGGEVDPEGLMQLAGYDEETDDDEG